MVCIHNTSDILLQAAFAACSGLPWIFFVASLSPPLNESPIWGDSIDRMLGVEDPQLRVFSKHYTKLFYSEVKNHLFRRKGFRHAARLQPGIGKTCHKSRELQPPA